MTLFSNPLLFILQAIALVVAITIHEYAHAKVADELGDPTPRLQKRVTLDPRAHLDLYGTILMFLFGFGWGRPVQFDPYNLRNPRRDAAIISIAGPISNILVAVLCAILIKLFILIDDQILMTIGSIVCVPLVMVNVMLAVFNLIPIHPLDGFKIVEGLLNEKQAREWHQLERMGMIFLIILIVPFGNRSMLDQILGPILNFAYRLLLPDIL